MNLSTFARRALDSFRAPELDVHIRQATDGMVREANQIQTIRYLSGALAEMQALEKMKVRDQDEFRSELEEAIAMAGGTPWQMPKTNGKPSTLRESLPGIQAQGAYGDIELALQNIDWRREVNSSWLEFSRWGIQQIILISRLYFLKNPMIQRGINVAALYVFGRGVEVTSTDPDANKVLQDFFQRNKRTLGQAALTDLERRKYYDGNLFFVLFTDKTNSGETNIGLIDATEITEIVSDPDDSSMPRFFQRQWVQKVFDEANGSFEMKPQKAWYPALGYEPEAREDAINGIQVLWASPVLHKKCGGVAKWQFGCPLVYAALDWARAARRFLEDCMTIRNSLAQFSLLLTTKGGQQAMQGAKTQLSTTVGPSASLWDQNPPATAGAVFSSGPGTKLEAFNSKGAGGDPAEVREYKLQVAMVFGIPESFFADMNTSNLATATSLDRPTELNFMAKQEEWRETLTEIAVYVLQTSYGAPSGQLREAAGQRKIRIGEALRVMDARGRMRYSPKRKEASAAAGKMDIEVMVNFPSIIEADVPAQVAAVVEAMTLGSKQGQVVGIDEKEGDRLLYQLLGTPNSEEILEEQFPSTGPDQYDPLRTQEEPVPEPAAVPAPVTEAKREVTAIRNALSRVSRAIRMFEAEE